MSVQWTTGHPKKTMKQWYIAFLLALLLIENDGQKTIFCNRKNLLYIIKKTAFTDLWKIETKKVYLNKIKSIDGFSNEILTCFNFSAVFNIQA